MKTKLSLTLLILALCPVPCALSQIPQGFNYQAVAFDGTGKPIFNTSLPVTITIQSDSLGGTIFWEELHSSVTTNEFGVFNLIIGKGVRQASSTVASFSDINWSVSPKFFRVQLFYRSELINMGSSRLWSVPFSMAAKGLTGPVDKLEIAGKTDQMDEALFEVKNRNGQTVFAVYNEGVRVYVADGAKGVKGGFAVGGFGTDKAESQKYLVVTKDSTRVYVDNNASTKKLKGGFAVGGYDMTKGTVQNYLDVSSDSIRMYIDSDPSTKKLKGGFAVGGYDLTKRATQDYLNVSPDSVRIYIDSDNTTKKLKGGFAVGGFDLTKEAGNEYIRVTTDSVKVSKSLLIPRLTTEERDNLPFTPGEALIIFNMSEGCMQIFKNKVWSNIWCFNCAPDFLIQPVDQTICSGENAVFFVSATGTSLSYQWQESVNNGNTWTNISNGGSNPAVSGVNSYTLTLANVPVGNNTYKYRCIVAGPCLPIITSNAVILQVGSAPPVITSQPTNQQLSAECNASFSISSPGFSVEYQWQQSADGGNTWNNISEGGINPVYSGVTNTILSVSNVPLSYIDKKFRCIVSNLCGADAISNTVSFIPNTSPVILHQPSNQKVYEEYNIMFNILTTDLSLLQWQESTDGGSTWTNITDGGSNPVYVGAKGDYLGLKNVPLSYNNYKYRCVVSPNCRPITVSDVATLSVAVAGLVTDIDGNTYATVGIGPQLWMAENLKTTKYSDGTPIALANTTVAWAALTETDKAYCWYGDNISNKDTYGALYTWPASMNGSASSNSNPSGIQGVCPTGWHLPSDFEWHALILYLDESASLFGEESLLAGDKMKETGTIHWNSPNSGNNDSGFTGLPGGSRDNEGTFSLIGTLGYWWCSTEEYWGVYMPIYRTLYYYNGTVGRHGWDIALTYGFSIRCMKD